MNDFKTLVDSSFYNSISSIKSLMDENGLTMQKRFGQNFLINESIRERIVNELNVNDGDKVWEVGPGIGAITSLLVKENIDLTLFEIDRGFLTLLSSLYEANNSITIVGGDALKTWPTQFQNFGQPDYVIGNLPYNVGSVIIASFIEKGLLPKKMVFTVQKEVALRMVEKPGTKNYSSFSMLCGLDYTLKRVTDISPGSFYPRPDVTSSVISMQLKEDDVDGLQNRKNVEIRQAYFSIIRDLFKSRRKTIRNNLIKSGFLSTMDKEIAEDLTSQCDIDLSDRGERLPIVKVWNLATLYIQKVRDNG